MSLRSKLLLAVTLFAFGAAHVAGIVKLQAARAADATVPVVTANIGD